MKARFFGTIVIGIALALGSGCLHPGEEGFDGGTTGQRTSGASTLRVVNNSGSTIWYLYVSPSSSSIWGNDQLGANVISPGESFRVTNIPCGVQYDLRAEGSGHGTLAERYNVYFACGSTVTWTFSN